MSTYMQVAFCFAVIGASALFAEKTRLFFAPFYIIAGSVLGPGMLNLVHETEVISLMGEIGVVFLLFFLGLEFSMNTLLENKKVMFSAGIIDFIINFGLGFGFGLLLGLNILNSLVVAGALYMSSSGIITKSILELQVSKKPEGQLIMGIMVIEDLVMIFFLAFISAGFSSSSAFNVAYMLTQLGKSILFCVGIVAFSIYGKKILNRILNIQKAELLLLVFFGVTLLITSLGELFEVSPALSAFFLGMAFSNAENVKRIEKTTIIFRDLFGSVFFFSFGMMMNLGDIAGNWNIIAICSTVAIFGKLLSSFLITKTQRCESHMSMFIGFITIPRGEFSLVISKMAGSSLAFLNPILVFTVLLTTLLSSLILRFSKFLCSVYNVCIIYPRSRIKDDTDWGEID